MCEVRESRREYIICGAAREGRGLSWKNTKSVRRNDGGGDGRSAHENRRQNSPCLLPGSIPRKVVLPLKKSTLFTPL